MCTTSLWPGMSYNFRVSLTGGERETTATGCFSQSGAAFIRREKQDFATLPNKAKSRLRQIREIRQPKGVPEPKGQDPNSCDNLSAHLTLDIPLTLPSPSLLPLTPRTKQWRRRAIPVPFRNNLLHRLRALLRPSKCSSSPPVPPSIRLPQSLLQKRITIITIIIITRQVPS